MIRKMTQFDLTKDVVSYINSISEPITLEFPNTYGLSSTLIAMLGKHVTIRIVGGLDESVKTKYKTQEYYDRTLYTPFELSCIIKKMELYERGINAEWNDLQKAMYIYKKLCETMNYSENNQFNTPSPNGDAARSLLGILQGNAVCAGFAMIYKEMMDRLHIECEYINKPHKHSWNAIKIDGIYYPVDLTFDVAHKEQGICRFDWFGRTTAFNEVDSHKSDESEKRIPANVFDTRLLVDTLRKINTKKINRLKMQIRVNSEGDEFYICQIPSGDNRVVRYVYSSGNNPPIVITDDAGSDTLAKLSQRKVSEVYGDIPYIGVNPDILELNNTQQHQYRREDGSRFSLLRMRDRVEGHLLSYKFLQTKKTGDTVELRLTNLYSEDDLVTAMDSSKEYAIANTLLSYERVNSKVEKCGGYVGFIQKKQGYGYQKYYNDYYERDIGHFVR